MFSGLSGMVATCVVQPIDLIKTRMQLSGEQSKSFVETAMNITKEEGFRNLYKGLSAGLFRQATYTTTRLGVFNVFMDYVSQKDKKTAEAFTTKLLGGVIAGGVGAYVGTPAEVALIRMTSDGRLPPDQRRNYKNVFDALARMTKDEGLLSLWRGCNPTVIRAVILNAAQLGCYGQAKQMLKMYADMKEGVPLHLTSSLIAGFFATAVSIPVDLAKTTLQSQKVRPDGTTEYKGSLDVLVKTVQKHGPLRLWRGFSPYFLRLGPHTVITFLVLEQFRMYFGK